MKKRILNYVLFSLCLSVTLLFTGCGAADSIEDTQSGADADTAVSTEVPSLNGFLTALNLSTDLDTIYTTSYQESDNTDFRNERWGYRRYDAHIL